MNRGRPTGSKQRRVKKRIQWYYENGISVNVTSKETGFNKKTIRKYYKILDRESDKSEEDFLSRMKATKENTNQQLETIIISLLKELRQIESLKEKAIANGDLSSFDRLSRLKLKTIDQLEKTMAAKMNLIGTPTADVRIKLEAMA